MTVESQPIGDANVDYMLTRDRVRRQIRPPNKFGYADIIAFALTAASEAYGDEPLSYTEAMKSADAKRWNEAMVEELKLKKKL